MQRHCKNKPGNHDGPLRASLAGDAGGNHETHILRTEIEIAHTELRNAVRRVERIESELAEAQAAAGRLREKVRELEQAGST